MKTAKLKNKILAAFMTLTLAITMMAGFPAIKVQAASGTVYTCTINRCYAHPVTGVIEDSGGESSYATGQGMVEGCVYSNGILEVTDDGAYYLTIRMSLMDYTSGHSFQVQNVGDSGWSTPSEIGVTGNGTDSNGTTADVCMRVPSENCVVRGSMYVEPMGRDVIFYVYPSDYNEGNNTDMNATMVTASSGESSSSESGSSDNSQAQAQESSTQEQSESTESETSGNSSLQSSQSTGNSSLQSSTKSDSEKTDSTDEKKTDSSTKSDSNKKKLESTITEAAKPASEETDTPSTDSSTLNSAEGLSLSTAGETADDATGTTASSGNKVFQIALAVTVSGLILIGAGAGVIYFFRKNWRRWGGADDDEE